MSNAFSELGILLGETIAPILISIVGKVTDIVQGFSDFIKNRKLQKKLELMLSKQKNKTKFMELNYLELTACMEVE